MSGEYSAAGAAALMAAEQFRIATENDLSDVHRCQSHEGMEITGKAGRNC